MRYGAKCFEYQNIFAKTVDIIFRLGYSAFKSFDYSLLDDFLNTWKKKKEDLASGKITKEEYFEWKINWPHAED